MTDVRSLVQAALDAVLVTDKVYTHWTRKTEVAGENPNEYIVCTLDGDPTETYADNEPLVKAANVTVRYYHRAPRSTVRAREQQIASALKAVGFSLPAGFFDGGDIDEIGFDTTIYEAYFWRVEA